MTGAAPARGPLHRQLTEAAERLRKSAGPLQSLDIEVRIDGLVRFGRAWLDPANRYRKQALATLPTECRLSEAQVAWGLDQAFGSLEERRLAAWWGREGEATTARLSAHISSGNVFVAGLPPVVASLLAGVPALLKAPGAHPTFSRLLAASLTDVSPELGESLDAASWDRSDESATSALLRSADVVFAFGADESIDTLRAAAGNAVFCGFGHRFSIGLVLKEALDGVDAESAQGSLGGLAVDHLAWDGQGCLTPRWVFVEGNVAQARHLAQRSAELLPGLAARLPGWPLEPAQGADRAAWLASAAFSGWSAGGAGWGVAASPAAEGLPAPAPTRCLSFVPLADLRRLPGLLAPLGRRLQGVSRLGPGVRDPALQAFLDPLGLSRLAPAGTLQKPPLDWNHDDVRILGSLCSA